MVPYSGVAVHDTVLHAAVNASFWADPSMFRQHQQHEPLVQGANTPFIMKSRGLSRSVAMSDMLNRNPKIKHLMEAGELVPDVGNTSHHVHGLQDLHLLACRVFLFQLLRSRSHWLALLPVTDKLGSSYLDKCTDRLSMQTSMSSAETCVTIVIFWSPRTHSYRCRGSGCRGTTVQVLQRKVCAAIV